jgi:hypothetical protein
MHADGSISDHSLSQLAVISDPIALRPYLSVSLLIAFS